MSDHNLWKNGIQHSKSPTTLTDVADGAGFIATAVIGGITTKSDWRMSRWDAYLDLYEKLHDGQRPVPKSTTTEANDLSGILDGTPILNITTNSFDVCNNGDFQNSAGIGVMKPAAYGNMYESNQNGSAMNPTTRSWITAMAGVFDGNSFISFLNNVDGDRLVIGTGGAGDYMVVASCGQTNSGNDKTRMILLVNGSTSTVIKDDQQGNATLHRPLVANGILTLADNDYLSLQITDPVTWSNVIKVYDCHLTIQRIS